MKKEFKNSIKRSFKHSSTVVMTAVLLLAFTITAYVVVSLFFSDTQTSEFSKKTIFECDTTSFFSGPVEVSP